VDHRQQGDGAGNWFGSSRRRRLESLELAAGRAVDDIPPAGAELFADRVGGLEVASLTAGDALV
jgi:hypothetical protein